MGFIVTTITAVILLIVIYEIYSSIYFNSTKFKELKTSIETYTQKCNDLNHHIEDLKRTPLAIQSIDYGNSTLKDTSHYNFKRSKWKDVSKSEYVHNCSAAVVKKADLEPFKYVSKYFNIKATEESLGVFETLLNNFSAAEEGKVLLKAERDDIITKQTSSVPKLIMSFSREKLIRKLGFEDIDFSQVHFPHFIFSYVSAGGNSSTRCDITFDIDNLERFVIYLQGVVKFKKSVAGQRSLMTSKLRNHIKTRDGHACKNCTVSVKDEPHLLLEIDHIIPVSKGGLTTEDNLQTLCWICNRKKGAKILA